VSSQVTLLVNILGIDKEQLKYQRERDWRRVSDSLEVSQKMIENLERTAEKIKSKDKSPLQKSHQKYTNEKERRRQSQERQTTDNPSRRTESSFASEVAEELWNNYVGNLQDLKEKVKQTIHYRKDKQRSNSGVKPRNEKRLSSTYGERDSNRKSSNYIRDEPSEKHSSSGKYYRDPSEFNRSRKRPHSPSENSNYNRSSYKPSGSIYKERRTQSVGKVFDIYGAYRRHDDRYERERDRNRDRERSRSKSRNERDSYKDMRRSSINEKRSSQGRSYNDYHEEEIRNKKRERSRRKEKERSHKESSKFIKEMDDFLMEKYIERLDNDKKLSDNPYFKLYKEMLVEKGKLKSSYSGSRRTSHSQSINPSYNQSLKVINFYFIFGF